LAVTIAKHELKYISSGKVSVLCDGQFGSTGKGLLAAYLACQEHNKVDIAVTNASANAGHWTKWKNGDNFVCYHLPTFGVVQSDCKIFLDAGSVINIDLLFEEIKKCGVDPSRILIHPMAAVIQELDTQTEQDPNSSMTKISSTQKGVGSALARKIMRYGRVAKDFEQLRPMIRKLNLNADLSKGAKVSLEIPQGFSLSLNSNFYPHCTSRNCTVMAGLSDADIHPYFLGQVAMSMRTYPIRVGSVPGGYSGDVYPDQEELTWEELGQEPELTTVTKRVRRVFTWSNLQCLEAMMANRPTITFLNFCNYADKEYYVSIEDFIQNFSSQYLGVRQGLLEGWGPCVEDVKPLP
jgi:adenylosuccinate synthase